MLGRFAAVAALIAVAGCAGVEPVGRNARAEPAPVARSAPPPQYTAPPPPPQTAAAPPPVSRPELMAPPPQAAPAPAPTQTAQAEPTPPEPVEEDDDAIVVPGQREMQVPPPAGDPRSVGERMEDVRAWDQCVTAAQSAYESDPMRPQLDTPEDYCRQNLGMASRTAVPDSRRNRRR